MISYMLYLVVAFLQSVEGNLRILAPDSLASVDDGIFESATSTFGAPKYGTHLLGNLYLPVSGSSHCEDDYEFPSNGTSDFHVFLFVDRGGCSFKRKVLVAERKGFNAVVFAQDETHMFQEISALIPADDGLGGEARIPSVVVSYLDGRRIRRAMRNSHDSIIAELSWSVPRRATMRLDMWVSPASSRDNKMLTSLRPILNELYDSKTDFRFYPHFNFFSLTGDGVPYCLDETNEFCAEGDPGVAGVDVAREQLRLMCMRSWAFNNTQRDRQFVDYMISSHECKSQGFAESCVNGKMKKSGIDISDVSRCANDSTLALFLLQLERASRAWSPHAIRINGYRYDGEYSSEGVRVALCSALSEEHKPGFCRPRQPEEQANPLWTFALVAVVFASIVGLLLIRGMKQQLLDLMHTQVQSEVRWALTERKPLFTQGP